MLGARVQMEEIGFMKQGEQPYFQAGNPIHVLGLVKPPSGHFWDPIIPTTAFAGHLARTYVPGEDLLLTGPMARTVHAAGTMKIFNMFGLLCGLNGFALWRDVLDEHGCMLYAIVNDSTRAMPGDAPCLTDLIKADPPTDAAAWKAYEDRILSAMQSHLFDNGMYIETSLVWHR